MMDQRISSVTTGASVFRYVVNINIDSEGKKYPEGLFECMKTWFC